MSTTKQSDEKPESKVQEDFKLDHELYSAVSCAAELREISLVESSYSIRPEVFQVVEDIERMNMRFHGNCLDVDFNAEDGIAIGRFEWQAEIKSGRKYCLKLKAIYLLVYTELKESDDAHVHYFFRKVGRFATYPYFRGHFAHNTAQTGLMIPPLPTLRERVD